MKRLAEITAGVLVATGDLYVTNSTVVADGGGGCLVIDPAVTVAEVAGIAADLAAMSLTPRAGFATHPHWDHVLWSADLGEVPRYASATTVEVSERERARLIDGVQRSAPGHDLELFGRLTPLDGDAIAWAGPAAQVVTHRGHAPGHSAVFLPDSGTLVAGDMCSDIEFPLLDLDQADPVGDYLAALDLLGALPAERIVPGHGTVGDAAELRRRIEADVAYLDRLRRGDDDADPRMTSEWLAAEHRRQVSWARGAEGDLVPDTDGQAAGVFCSFCLKPAAQVMRVVAGPGVYICNECVGLCVELIDTQTAPALPTWEERLSDEDLLATLRKVEAIGRQASSQLATAVRTARGRGITWTRIGAALGMTRQSAWERFSGEE